MFYLTVSNDDWVEDKHYTFKTKHELYSAFGELTSGYMVHSATFDRTSIKCRISRKPQNQR